MEEKIINLYSEGYTIESIAAKLNQSTNFVAKIISQYADHMYKVAYGF